MLALLPLALALGLVTDMALLEDPGGRLTAAEAWSEAWTAPGAVAVPPAGVNLGFSASTYWLRLRVRAPGPGGAGSYMLDLGSTLDEAALYEAPDTPPRRVRGDVAPSRREVPSAFPVFRVALEPGAERQLLVAVRSRDTLRLHPRLVPEAAFWREHARGRAGDGIYYGLILALVAYNLFLFAATRERAYLAYTAFQAAFALSQAAFDKHTFDLLWPSHPVWAARSEQVLGALACVTALVFARLFLRTAGRLDLFIRALAGASALVAVAACFTAGDALKWSAGVVLLGSIGTMAASALVVALRTRATDARVFAVAWGVMLAASGVAVLSSLGAVVTPGGFPLMKVGSAIEAVLLSLALAGRINALRREREEAQRALLREKSARLEALQALVSGVAHEIGNPLNFARGGAEELGRRLEAGDLPAARRAGALALSGLDRIKRILDNLRSYLRAGDVEEVPTDLAREIDAALELAADRLAAAGISVERRTDPALLPISARPGELHQVLMNLVTNAAQAMPDGGALVIEAAPRGAAVELAIEDTGPGVPPAERERIFEPFVTARGGEGGTGLGLAVAREIVLRHGGSIWVEAGRGPAERPGARFVVRLPTSPGADRSP